MKKIIKIILVLFVTLTLGACGSSEEKDTNKPTKTEEKKEEKIYTIGETVTYTKNNKDLIHLQLDSVRKYSMIVMNLQIVNQNKSLSYINS